jgi:4-hydroxy-3-methylbut-2-enyl diphosphate reductase IspH
VGGRSSANTSRLVEIARTACPRVLHVEQAAELPRSLIQGCKRVGVVAGSSTPSWVVRDIVRIARGPSRAALAPNRGRARASRGSKCPVTRRIVSNAE